MNKILSQDEVDALLKAVEVPGTDLSLGPELEPAVSDSIPEELDNSRSSSSPSSSASSGRQVLVYDFRRPDRVPKAFLRSMQLLHEKFCTNLSSSLSAYLRAVTEVSTLSVEQTTYAAFLLSLEDPTCFNAISMKPLNGLAALEINLDLAFPLIDRLLGGSGKLPVVNRNITEIERNIIQGVINAFTVNLTEAWRAAADVTFHFYSSESRPQLLQITIPNEVVILFTFEVKLAEIRGSMRLCIPYSSLEPVSKKFEQEIKIPPRGNHQEDFKRLLNHLRRIPLTVSAELPGTYVAVKDLLSLKVGDIIRLDHKISDNILLRVGGKPSFRAQLAKTDAHKVAQVVGQTDSSM
jgi:flagellar motor switch protein FliM